MFANYRREVAVRGKAIMSFPMQWESGRTRQIYYTPSEKATQKGRPHQAFFRVSFPEYSVLTNLSSFFSTYVSPHWTIFATSF
jgi:hypothetical protein